MSAGITLLYICYLLLFRKETFYLRNRIYLVLTLLLPAIIPAVRIPVQAESQAPVISQEFFTDTVASSPAIYAAMPSTPESFDFNRLFLIIYFVVAAILVLKGLISIIATYRIIFKGRIVNGKFPKVVISEERFPPFSFFPFVVVPAEDYENDNCPDILDHEFAHVRQGHTFDLLLSELFTAVQWFNPFVWLIKRSVILNHEYLADQVSLCRRDTKEYQYRLLSFQPELKKIVTVHSFNSFIKNRIIMINKKPTRRFAAAKSFLILPAVAFVTYAFAIPEYNNTPASDNTMVIYSSPSVIQKKVEGIVFNEEGKPLAGVHIFSTGIQGESFHSETGSDGRFVFANEVKPDATLIFLYDGYKQIKTKPVFNSAMTIKMERDPEYKAPVKEAEKGSQVARKPELVVAVDGVITDKSVKDVGKELGYNIGITEVLMGKKATDKYGEKGANGVYDIITRKKALEMGLNPPYPRLVPDDYPTFQNKPLSTFQEWVVSHVEYPAEAKSNNIEGWATVKFNVEPDGSITNIAPEGDANTVLAKEVIRVVKSSPKWEAPKNKAVEGPYSSTVVVRFKLPDRVANEMPYVMVEQMPQYPGGDKELLNFVYANLNYPESARAEKKEGKVIVRFIVNTEGNVEAVSVRKGVSPALDAEAVRVISLLKGFKPGMNDGKAVNVWYSMPISFTLTKTETPK